MQRRSLLIDAIELDSERRDPSLVILDCRSDLLDKKAGRRAFLTGHIPGASFTDLEKDLAAATGPGTGRHPLPTPERAVDAFRRVGVNNHSRVVAYDDRGGACAARAWWMLRWLGHRDVRLLDGGFQAWTNAGLPVEKGNAEGPRGDFDGVAAAGWTVDAQELMQLDLAETFLCDARDSERFSGEVEPIDSKAGHIPGARNTPFMETLDENAQFLATEQLVSFWVKALDGRLDRNWVAMCGSGVTACHLAVSALLAGAEQPRLYAGSWSEWITDPERPTSTGHCGADTAR